MSYPVSQPPAKARPTVVNVAVYLMWGVVAAQVVGLILSYLPNEQLDRAVDEFMAAHPDYPDSSGFESLITIPISLVIIVGLGVLAVFVGKGNQAARVTTWVLSGLGVLCIGCLSILAAAAPTLLNSAGDSAEAQLQREYFDMLMANTPGWLAFLITALNVLVLLALIGVIILLALPAANDYFRKQQETWVPPSDLTGGGWPSSPQP
jgi:hypothetical protein